MNSSSLTHSSEIATDVERLLIPLIHIAALLEQASELVQSLPKEDRLGPAHTGHTVGSSICALVDVARDMVETTAEKVMKATDSILAERRAAR